jgi:hypothetical protein
VDRPSRLVTLAADLALPEFLMARQQRLVKVLAVMLAILIVLGGRHLYWSVAGLVLALFAGGYPLRRRLSGETASLPVYLWRSIRSVIGGVGFWFALLWTPAIVLAIDPGRWPLEARHPCFRTTDLATDDHSCPRSTVT